MYAHLQHVFPRLSAAALRRLRLGALTASATGAAAAAATYAAPEAPSDHSDSARHWHRPARLPLPLAHSHADAPPRPQRTPPSPGTQDWHGVVRALREAQQAHKLCSGFRATRRAEPHTEGRRWTLTIEFPVSATADAHAVLVALATTLGHGEPSRLTVSDDDAPGVNRVSLVGPDELFEVSLSVSRATPAERRVAVRMRRGLPPFGDSFSPAEIDALVRAYTAGQARAPDTDDEASDDEADDADGDAVIGILDGRGSVDVGPATYAPKRPPPSRYQGHEASTPRRRRESGDGDGADDDDDGMSDRCTRASAGAPGADGRMRAAMDKLHELGVEVIDGDSGLTWDVLAGYSDVKERIENTLTLPLKHPEVYERIVRGTRVRAECNVPKAVLYEGPPGCGKTLSARILAATIGIPFVHVKVESILSKFYGETTRKLSEILEAADELGRCIVFLDECDSVGMRRSGATEVHEGTRRTLSVLLRFIDGMDGARQPIVLAATNHKEDLDAAFVSRFDVVVSFPLPDAATRVAMLRLYAKQLKEPELRELARLTCGFSGRELLDVCEEAERMRAGEILRDIGREAKSDDEGDGRGEGDGDGESDGEGEIESEAFALPTMKQYTVAVERKAMHVVGRTDERFMSPSILAELAGLESAAAEPAVAQPAVVEAAA